MFHSSFLPFFFPFPLPSFHPSLPHIHDPVINLVEISRSLINACPPSFPLAVPFSFDCIGFWVFFVVFFFLPLSFISSLLFCLFRWWEWGNVQCEGSKRIGWVSPPPPPSIHSGTVSNADSETLTTEYDGLNSWRNSFYTICAVNIQPQTPYRFKLFHTISFCRTEDDYCLYTSYFTALWFSETDSGEDSSWYEDTKYKVE